MSISRKKILSLPIAIAFMLVRVGILNPAIPLIFDINLRLIGYISIGILYGIRYSSKSDKTLKDTSKLLMVVAYIAVMSLSILKFTDLLYLNLASLIFGAGWFILEIIDVIKPKEVKGKINPVLWAGIIFTVLFVLIKVMRWPFAGPMYLLCNLLSSIGFFIDYYLNKPKSVEN